MHDRRRALAVAEVAQLLGDIVLWLAREVGQAARVGPIGAVADGAGRCEVAAEIRVGLLAGGRGACGRKCQ